MEENTVPDLNKKRSKSQKLGPPAKKNKLEQTDENSLYNYKTNKNEYSLLDFSDDVLLEILKNLNTGDLINLGQSCTRLEQLIRDRTLWGKVDLRTSDINGSSLKDYVNYLLPNTKSFAVKGCEASIINQNVARRLYNEPEGNERVNTSGIHRPVNENVQAELLLENLNGATMQRDVVENICKISPNIEEFIVENHFIDGLELLLEHFPSNLIHLSLKDCCVYRLPDNKSYFFGFHEKFPKIECLDLTNCLWYTCHSFFALSKSKTLKKLILYGCSQIYNCVPYISLAFRIGFNSLTSLDLRRTMISDRELGCLNNSSLMELYLEKPPDIRQARLQVTDLGITSLGNNVQHRVGYDNVIVVAVRGSVAPPPPLQKLVVIGYDKVTDRSLAHIQKSLLQVTYLDISGTGCTRKGVRNFKKNRPQATVVSNY